jgi:hypothetical protein
MSKTLLHHFDRHAALNQVRSVGVTEPMQRPTLGKRESAAARVEVTEPDVIVKQRFPVGLTEHKIERVRW